MGILRFSPNVPIAMHLRSLEGKPVESQFGGMQHLFVAEEGPFYVSDKVGGILTDQFRSLGVRPGDPVEIMKAVSGSGPGQRTQWQVAVPVAAAGEQPNGTFAVPKEPARNEKLATSPDPPQSQLEQQLADSIRLVEARKAAQKAAVLAWTESLVMQTNALVDAYALVLKHSAKHEGLVKGEDIRSIFLSAYINASKSGVKNVA